jgi:molybdopterin-guanine dinucleotide biosynthesis protein A
MIVGLVLAGGQATRMGGGDKCLLPLGGATVLDVLLARLLPQVSSITLSANGDHRRFARFGLPVLGDEVLDAGPLAGVAAGLAWAAGHGATALLTVPGDTPFIPAGLVAALSPAPAWAESEGAVHPLVALWPCALNDRLAAWLRTGGSRRVRDFGLAAGMRAVQFGETDAFFNINTPDDLAAAQGRVSALPPV